MTPWQHAKHLLAENQILVVLLALILGLALPDILRPLNAFSTQLLIIVFFTSSLRLSLHELLDYAKDWKMLLLANIFMLIVLPFSLFLPFTYFSTSWALALLILGAMPTGMTIALVADFFGGKTSLALLVTSTTSLLAPFTIPLVFKIAVGQNVPIPVLQMFWSLFLTIVIPFVFAMLVKRAVPRFVAKHDNHLRQLSVLAFGVLIAGIVADTSGDTLIALSMRDVIVISLFVIWMGALTWASYSMIPWRQPSERITIALCMVYLNNTLALFIGDRFFHDQGVVPKLIFLLVIVNVLLPPLKWVAAHIIHAEKPARLVKNNNLFT